jgi:dTDP-4-dehydrorhamnose reductase
MQNPVAAAMTHATPSSGKRRNVLVIGHLGQLGQDMVLEAAGQGFSAAGEDFPAVDITRLDSVKNAAARHNPGVIINCAAYTAVDLCETEPAKASAVNADGVQNLALAARECGAKLVHISTDYVFDGTKKSPYVESDSPNPLSVYGKSKLEGEKLLAETYDRHFIVRVAWLYGTRGNNFLKTIRGRARKCAASGEPLKVVKDQIGTPTYTMHVCRQLLSLMHTEHFGLYHCTNEGSCSWYDFAGAIVKAYGIKAHVVPCTTAEFPRPAPRPANSVLENERLKKLGLNIMPQWEKGLEEYLEEEKKINSIW